MKILALFLSLGSFYLIAQAFQMSEDASKGLVKFSQDGIQYICISIAFLFGSILCLILDSLLEDKNK